VFEMMPWAPKGNITHFILLHVCTYEGAKDITTNLPWILDDVDKERQYKIATTNICLSTSDWPLGGVFERRVGHYDDVQACSCLLLLLLFDTVLCAQATRMDKSKYHLITKQICDTYNETSMYISR
jgi:hypothetical protein